MGGSHGGNLLHSKNVYEHITAAGCCCAHWSAMNGCKGLSALFRDLLCPCQKITVRYPEDKQLYKCCCLLMCRMHHARTPASGTHMQHLQGF